MGSLQTERFVTLPSRPAPTIRAVPSPTALLRVRCLGASGRKRSAVRQGQEALQPGECTSFSGRDTNQDRCYRCCMLCLPPPGRRIVGSLAKTASASQNRILMVRRGGVVSGTRKWVRCVGNKRRENNWPIGHLPARLQQCTSIYHETSNHLVVTGRCKILGVLVKPRPILAQGAIFCAQHKLIFWRRRSSTKEYRQYAQACGSI